MKTEEYDRIVKELEVKAASDPKGYIMHVTKLMILGYAYIFGLIAFLLGMVALLIWLLFFVHAWILIKFSWILLIAAWLVFKSLWVKYSEPEGLRLKKDQVPALFELIAEVRAAADGPPIHDVVLSDEFNCAIMQVPRLGIFGWHKNFLILGLPMMQSVSPSQFKSILAHEMGHLSDQHGKFSAWVYHVRAAWLQTYVSLAYEAGFGLGLIKGFANWFVPLFDAHTYVLLREHEYAADRISAKVAGPESAAHALIQTALKGTFLNEEYWKGYWKQVVHSPSPPERAFSNLKHCFQKGIDAYRAEEFLKAKWVKHETNDSHPALAERVKALLPERDWTNPQSVAVEAAERFVVDRTAADEYFGSAVSWMETELDARFHASMETAWTEKHEGAVAARTRLDELEKESLLRSLNKEEVLELTTLSGYLDEADVAAEKYKKAVDLYPEDSDLHYGLGMLLLELKKDDGIAELESSVKLKPLLGPSAYGAIYGYYLSQGKEEAAQPYYKKAIAIQEEIDEASEEFNKVTTRDKFEEHKLSKDEVDELAAAVGFEQRVKEVYVVAKIVPEILGAYQHILCAKMAAFTSEEHELESLQNLANLEQVSGFFLLTWPAAPNNLRDACKRFPTALIFERNSKK